MLYKEVNFNERKPLHKFKEYFFIGWSKSVQLIQSSGYITNMEEYQVKCDKLVWLEPSIDAVEELNKILVEEINKSVKRN